MINGELLTFFEELKQNNNREWFEPRKAAFKALKAEFEAFMDDVAGHVAEVDPAIDLVLEHPKTIKVYRIYRDVRFSKDKSPFKINIGGSISAGEGRPTYYLHVEPGKSFAGGGYYMPTGSLLKALRQKIEDEHDELEALLADEDFANVFPDGLSVMGDELKTAPRGYAKDHDAIKWLRKKHFIVTRALSDDELVDEGFEAQLAQIFEQLSRFNMALSVDE